MKTSNVEKTGHVGRGVANFTTDLAYRDTKEKEQTKLVKWWV